MEKMNSYFYFRGKSDENQHVRLTHREIIDQYSLFYHLGILSEKFKNRPTRISFIDELYHNFMQYNRLPNSIVVILNTEDFQDCDTTSTDYTLFIQNRYSHKIMRQIFSCLGYDITEHTSKIFIEQDDSNKIKEISKWTSFVVSR